MSSMQQRGLTKAETGIHGLDDITNGGLPRGRTTLVYGGPGCGKTALAMEFVCRGFDKGDTGGVFVSLEERREDLLTNFGNWKLDVAGFVESRRLRIEEVFVGGGVHGETGSFTLDGLLVRLARWVEQSQANRLVLDGLDSLISRFDRDAIIRHEVAQLFRWCKDQELTTIVTAEIGENGLTRHGLEEYISDCVIFLDHRIEGQVAKRRLRIIKYRGSNHGKDEYPFLIGSQGLSILPLSTISLNAAVSTERISSGIAGLDAMLDGDGYYKGSTILVSGVAGTGKSSLAATFAERVCADGKRCLYLAFEESGNQVARNMASIGIDLAPHIEAGALRIEPIRPSTLGLEEHLVRVHKWVEDWGPFAIVMDPISSFGLVGGDLEIKAMFVRLLDYLKGCGITVFMTTLTPGSKSSEETEMEVSSLTDAWIVLNFKRHNGSRYRQLYVHKARGLAHSEELAELQFSASGPSVKPLDKG